VRISAPRLARLIRRSEFQAAAGDGRRFRSAALGVQVLARDGGPEGVRLGITASRKVGGAVERNRIRRRLRAAAREAYAEVSANVDVVALARAETISEPYDTLIDTLRQALTKARPQRKQQATPGPGGAHATGFTRSERQETQPS
jgi:ribonuclease P protein component